MEWEARQGGHAKCPHQQIENMETPMHTESNVENQPATVRHSTESTQDLAATAPGQLRVI